MRGDFEFTLGTRVASATAGLAQDPPDGVNASPHPDNIMQWNAVIFGPEDTVWDGGRLSWLV